MTGSYFKQHCIGHVPEVSKHGRYWQIRCPGCGKKINYYHTQAEARFDWNVQCECDYRMKGEKND